MKFFSDMSVKVLSFFQNEEGASAIEYAIIAGLIALAIIAAVSMLGDEISATFSNIAGELSGSAAGSGG